MDDFLKHPKVEYIPLSIDNSVEGDWNYLLYDDPAFYIFQNQKEFTARLTHFGLPQMALTSEDMENNLGVIALNFHVKRGYFRFLTIKYIGEIMDRHYQIFLTPKKYFPKRVLHFALYSEEGKRLSWENIEIL